MNAAAINIVTTKSPPSDISWSENINIDKLIWYIDQVSIPLSETWTNSPLTQQDS